MPSYLSQEPPVLVDPGRVVPLSESEKFARNFQPNVALAPPKLRDKMAREALEAERVKTEQQFGVLTPSNTSVVYQVFCPKKYLLKIHRFHFTNLILINKINSF